MCPTLALGLAVRHAVRPAPHVLPLIVGTGLATLFSGLLGMITGFISTFKYVEACRSSANPLSY